MNGLGQVHLVGAGPGDTGLLTLRGAELLTQADVVVHDGLINGDLLRLVRPGAEIIYGGKHDRSRVVPQANLNAILIAQARAGRRVVRLKGGDPYVFGRGGEEAAALASAGIPFEVVPGISSAVAVPNYAGIPLTHRDYCSSFTVITGHEEPGRATSRFDWETLARLRGTLVVLMGRAEIRNIAAELIRHGRSPDTPAVTIQHGTTGRQQSVAGTLATLADLADAAGLGSPALTIIGEVATLRPQLNWFEQRPLLGQRVVVTLAREAAAPLVRQLRENGAAALEIPAVKSVAVRWSEAQQQALATPRTYDWLLFSNPLAVQAFFEQFFQHHRDWRELGAVRIAAFGPQTAAALEQLHLRVDAVPEDYVPDKIAAVLADDAPLAGRRILLLRSVGASAELPTYLRQLGAQVDDLGSYQLAPETEDATGDAAKLLATGAEWITFNGVAAVEQFHARFELPQLVKRFPQLRFATIGPRTSQPLKALGLDAAAIAAEPTLESLVAAVVAKVTQEPTVTSGSTQHVTV